jgi:hypothetical protein
MTQGLRIIAFAATLAGGLMASGPAAARSPMSDAEMAARRAGIQTPWGYEIGLGAVVRTFINGELTLESRLTWSDQGLTREFTVGQPTPDAQAAAARLGLALDEDWIGLIFENPDGYTAALNSITSDRVGNLIVNTASNQDVRLETELILDIPELEQFKQQFQTEQLDLRIQDAVTNAVVGAGP